MTLLSAIVAASSKVAATSARSVKVRELAACLRQLQPDEIVIGVAYLSGEPPQGRFGIGYSVLKTASGGTYAVEPTLTLLEVDRRLTELAGIRGRDRLDVVVLVGGADVDAVDIGIGQQRIE